MRSLAGLSRSAAVLTLALATGGCLTGDGGAGSPAAGTAPASGDGLGRFFFGAPATQNSPETAAAMTPVADCPPIDVRDGAAAFQVYTTPREGERRLRYQAVVGQTARECNVVGEQLVFKIGIEGRLLAGEAAAGSRVEVPLRLAIVQEGPVPKPIWSKFYRVPVQIPSDSLQTSFIHVEDNLSLPLPRPRELDMWVIYVGFDANAPEEKPRQKPRGPARSG
jgi:hypothetical protein